MKKIFKILALALTLFLLTACSSNTDNLISNTASDNKALEKSWYTYGEINITENELDSIILSEYKKPRNIIVMIGDGMGPNDIILAEKYSEDTYEKVRVFAVGYGSEYFLGKTVDNTDIADFVISNLKWEKENELFT